ncbi:MAG: DUF4834 family protein [Bacteroidaceae bacterium]|nr:DUF4834 family protein [Bacteroidaceae bacterium]
MMRALGCLFACFVAAVLFLGMLALQFVHWLRNVLFGPWTRSQTQTDQQERTYTRRQEEGDTQTTGAKQQHDKVFPDSEGEYVDFEEL